MDDVKIHNMFRHIVKDQKLADKVICFIPKWGSSKLDPTSNFSVLNEGETSFILQRNWILKTARKLVLEEGYLSFFCLRNFKETQREKIKKINLSEEVLFKENKLDEYLDQLYRLSPKHKKYHNLSFEMENLLEQSFSILPDNDTFSAFLDREKKDGNVADLQKIYVLCIDYKYFIYSLVGCFLKSQEDFLSGGYEIRALLSFLKKISQQFSPFTVAKIKKLVKKIKNNQIEIGDLDELEYLSENHIQFIKKPFFWNGISQKGGYLCKENRNINEKNKNDVGGSEVDIRFFNSFESLLFWELKQILKYTKRCKKCNSVLNKISGKIIYCQPGDLNFKHCSKNRNNERQKKHYILTKS